MRPHAKPPLLIGEYSRDPITGDMQIARVSYLPDADPELIASCQREALARGHFVDMYAVFPDAPEPLVPGGYLNPPGQDWFGEQPQRAPILLVAALLEIQKIQPH